MSFKKKYIKKNTKKSPTLILNIFWFFAIISIFCLWFFILNSINFVNIDFLKQINLNGGNNTDDNNINGNENDNEKNKINILILWRWWRTNDAPNLTDTIILASINSDTKIISMLSIPRDFYVKYDNWGYWKINAVYANESNNGKDQKTWIHYLSKKISEMTWEKIDYYVNLDFEWFQKIIDILWWVKITIDEGFTDSSYPDWNWWYKIVTFKKWTWLFDWESALKYARSRHSTSDFDRSLRQQQIIEAIKEKLTTAYILTSPLKVKELYDTFKTYVLTNIELKNMIWLALKLKTSNYKIQSSNINNSYWEKWWFLYTPNRELFWWASVLLLNWTDVHSLSEYELLNKYSDIVFNHSKLYEENYKINIFNSLKKNYLASAIADDLKLYWLNIPKINSIWNTKKVYEKSIIYYNSIDKNSETIQVLKSFYPEVEFMETKWNKYSKELDTKIEIIIWNDYKEIFNIK